MTANKSCRSMLYRLCFSCFLFGCASVPPMSISKNPLEAYQIAKMKLKNYEDAGDYSLEYLQSKAAQYLLSQGKTELKSANSALAVKYLSQAREYNPWNDEIKDLYILSVKFLVRSTKELSNDSCEVINDRLALIYSVANDQMSNFETLTKRCQFSLNTSISKFQNIPLPLLAIKNEKTIFASLEDEAITIINRNNYVPKRELAYLTLNYLSELEFNLGEPKISPFTSSADEVIIKVPITARLKNEIDSKDYCEKTKELLWRQDFEDEILSPDYLKGNAGHLRCRYYYGGTRYLDIYTNPDWHSKFSFLYPLPTDAVYVFTFTYKNGTKSEFRNVFQNSFRPDAVQFTSGFLLHFLKGELLAKLKPSKVFSSEVEQFLEITTNQKNITGLKSISFTIDMQSTFNYFMKEEYKDIEHISTGSD